MSDTKVTITWVPEDIAALRPDWTEYECSDALAEMRKPLQDRSIELGWGIIEQLLEQKE